MPDSTARADELISNFGARAEAIALAAATTATSEERFDDANFWLAVALRVIHA